MTNETFETTDPIIENTTEQNEDSLIKHPDLSLQPGAEEEPEKAAPPAEEVDAVDEVDTPAEEVDAVDVEDTPKEEVDAEDDFTSSADRDAAETAQRAEELKRTIKQKIDEGNVNKIRISRKGKELLTIPVNVGFVGGILGIAVAPWAMIFAAVAAYGLDCKFEIIRNDGSSEEL